MLADARISSLGYLSMDHDKRETACSLYEESDRSQTITAKKKTKSMNSHQKTQEYIKGKSPLFIL